MSSEPVPLAPSPEEPQASPADESGVGIAHWAQAVLTQYEAARPELAEEPVHDLRVAIRRCRSMAEGLAQLDPHPGWNRLRRTPRALFRTLGDLRDLQVMELWLARLAPAENPVRAALETLLRQRQEREKQRSAKALRRFNRKRWSKLAAQMAPRAEQFPLGGPAFQHQALLRWDEAYALHRLAMRDRSKVAFHRLRIGLKRFRYTVENFLPDLYRSWKKDLKGLQDLLGEVHDLDVLFTLLPQAGAVYTPAARADWRARIEGERKQRLAAYRKAMIGSRSRWHVWRGGLPLGEALEEAALASVAARASRAFPGMKRGFRLAEVSCRLYQLLAGALRGAPFDKVRWKSLLTLACWFHAAGPGAAKTRARRAPKRILRVEPPFGWTPDDLKAAAEISRCSRTANFKKLSRRLAAESASRRKAILTLAGILRLGQALQKRRIEPSALLAAESRPGAAALRIRSPQGAADRLFLELSGRKNLLEWACRKPLVLEIE